MAKRKGGDNKSEAIRQILDANPKAKPRQIVVDLAEKGIEVTAQFVSTIKTKHKGRKGRPKTSVEGEAPRRGRPPGKASAAKAATSTSGGLSLQGLLQVKDLVNKLGGLAKTKEALAALEQIVG